MIEALTVIDLALTIVVLGTMLIALGVLVDVSKRMVPIGDSGAFQIVPAA
jgi:hypothetical protein